MSVAAGVSTDNAYGIINVKIIDDTNTTYGPFPMTAYVFIGIVDNSEYRF